MHFSLACTACAWTGPDADIAQCPACGGTLDVVYASAAVDMDTARPGLFRWASRLPLRDPSAALSLGEGNTPLVRSHRLGDELRLSSLFFKVEGSNPTGSYKDRIAAVGVARLRELGKTAWAATSSGNAGAAIAAYGAQAGLEGYLFTLEKASRAKIAQILAYGPHVTAVARLGYDPDVEKLTWANIRRLCAERNWQMLVTARAFSPHAMEGIKTIAFEVCEQLHGAALDVVYVPVGGGGLLSASWKGFVEAHAAGVIPSLPKMVAVQACGCDAITQAWREDRPVSPIAGCTSAISGIQLTAPPDGDLVLRALRESGGWCVSVPDAETYRAQAELAANEGLFVEPASAITLAALRADRAAGRLRSDERVACWLTGTGFKDATALQNMVAEKVVGMVRAEEIISGIGDLGLGIG
ncbi:MAG: pyridoxal-phosphate dependent enzyme [Caldilineaceae bacterium]|nr:pyridoxal-phosphate dependent enzyme [Caldilineaceae bacterium]